MFKYGFNTLEINEDFVHAWHPKRKITAKLKNANGTFTASWNPVLGYYSKEVRHSGNTVTYSYSY
uniref:mediterrocin family bacteriocin n=1 Tax=Siminovitchia sp. FSL H7-0308 TaxID=2921432 RepID=UPI00403F29BF